MLHELIRYAARPVYKGAEAIFDYFLNHFFLNVHYEQENNGFVHYEHK